MVSLIEYHRTVFLDSYHKCSTGKEKFLRLELEWHAGCSILLLPKDSTAESVFPNIKDETVHDIRKLWQEFCDLYPDALEKCKKIMILFSSAMYKMFFEQARDAVGSMSNIESAGNNTLALDDDDVYYRFGGATLADMLKLRYQSRKRKGISSASASSISQQIQVLHSINTKEKSSMPSYLKFRDRGFMYTPHPSFIPFFRGVDDTVREIVNPTGFQEYTNELVKASYRICNQCVLQCLCLGSSFSCE